MSGRSGIGRARHRCFEAHGSLVDDGEECGVRFCRISRFAKGEVSLEERDRPCRQERRGGQPGVGVGRLALIASGVPEHDARAAMIASGRFTVGSVLEEQAEASFDAAKGGAPADGPSIDHEAVFEDGLSLILDGLAARLPGGASAGAGGGAVKRKGRKG